MAAQIFGGGGGGGGGGGPPGRGVFFAPTVQVREFAPSDGGRVQFVSRLNFALVTAEYDDQLKSASFTPPEGAAFAVPAAAASASSDGGSAAAAPLPAPRGERVFPLHLLPQSPQSASASPPQQQQHQHQHQHQQQHQQHHPQHHQQLLHSPHPPQQHYQLQPMQLQQPKLIDSWQCVAPLPNGAPCPPPASSLHAQHPLPPRARARPAASRATAAFTRAPSTAASSATCTAGRC